jgi:hypothetical protein
MRTESRHSLATHFKVAKAISSIFLRSRSNSSSNCPESFANLLLRHSGNTQQFLGERVLDRERRLQTYDALVIDLISLESLVHPSTLRYEPNESCGKDLGLSTMYEKTNSKRNAHGPPMSYNFQHQRCPEPLMLEAGSIFHLRRPGRRRNLVRVLLAALVGAVAIS